MEHHQTADRTGLTSRQAFVSLACYQDIGLFQSLAP